MVSLSLHYRYQIMVRLCHFKVRKLFKKKRCLEPLGIWHGSIATLSDTKGVSTNFYRLVFSTIKGKQTVLALETNFLGPSCFGDNYKICLKFASHFGVNPTTILSLVSGDIQILLCIDAIKLLMDIVQNINGRRLEAPPWIPGNCSQVFAFPSVVQG